ncbi:MAG: primosomal protein N' [Nitrospirae bacterium]|nr:primosomal protein N' [Nitrospirota bacterium]
MTLEKSDSLWPIAEVVLFKHLDRVFHYSVPEALRDRIEPGMRVLVPFRNEWQTGIVTRRLRQADVAKVKPILDLLDPAPLLDRPMMALARWLSEYYVTGWGIAMKAILPPGLEARVGRHYRLTEAGRKAIADSFRKGETGRRLLTALGRAPRGLRLEALALRIPVEAGARRKGARRLSGPLALLVRKGWIEERRVMPRRRSVFREKNPESQTPAPPASPEPRSEPERIAVSVPVVLDRAVCSGRFSAVYLEGDPDRSRTVVTAVIRQTLRRGRSAILLVPEIGRIPDWSGRLESEIGAPIGILHSGLTDRDRRAEWEKARRGEVSVVVGTRLAVLAPVANPGLIVVEDEWDPAYKQEESPRYHARDVAVLRAAHHHALALLTGASPSVETCANVQNGKYQTAPLDDQRPDRPAVRIVNLADQPRGMFVSDELLSAATSFLDQKKPVVMLLNRRGFGGALYCRDCGGVTRCPRCEVAMVYSKRDRRLTCHYCGTAVDPPKVCPHCRGTHLEIVGAGTERAEEFFRTRFPSAKIERLDRDMAAPGDAAAAVGRLNRSEIDLLIGTPFLLNGPKLSRPGLVGLLLADGAFHLPDFRAGEQTFQLTHRVLNFSTGGEVILQTRHPAHGSIAWAATGDPRKFYEQEMAQRKALGYPPFMRLAVVTVKALKKPDAEAVARRLAERLKQAPQGSGLQILGPADAMRPRLRGKHRCQILIKAPDSRVLHEALAPGLRAIRSGPVRAGVWFEVDVDPQQIA